MEPIDDLADVSSIIESDNVGVSKFLIVVSHDCLEISRLSQMVIDQLESVTVSLDFEYLCLGLNQATK